MTPPLVSISPQWSDAAPLQADGPITRIGGAVRIDTAGGPVTVSLTEFGARIRLGPEPQRDYGLLSGQVVDVMAAFVETNDGFLLETADDELQVTLDPLSFVLRRDGRIVQQSSVDGHFVRPLRLPPFARVDGGWLVNLDLTDCQGVYGLGEKWGRLDKRGQLVESHNHDALGVNAERSYKNAPFAWSPDGWGLFAHTPARVVHAVGHGPWSHRAYGLFVEDESAELFLIAGEDGEAILKRYVDLTGHAPVPPLWSLGVILSRAYYRVAEEVLGAAREVRRRELPCDVITFDGRAWQDTDTRFSFAFDPKRYPEPKAVIDELKALNFKVCVWEYPMVSASNRDFQEMADKGWFLTDAKTGETYIYEWDPEPFGQTLTQLPPSGLIDFTHPDAYAHWRDAHKPLFELGVDMIKADFGEQVLDGMRAHNGEHGAQLHNVYAHLYNRCVYEAAALYSKNGPFLFSRSSWTGCQRYPAQWGGDPQADWGGLIGSIRGGLSWGLTGGPYFATDVGGFYGDNRDATLYIRWLQASVFSAHLRLHGIGAREPWSYGPKAEAVAADMIALRYRLLPYIHRTVEDASRTGLPAQRAMALAFPNDPCAWGFDQQFMFGEDILVAPCVSPHHEVRVYLPEGAWARFPTGERFEGGRLHRLTLDLSEFAAFVRVGARIPLGPVVQHTDELPGHPIIEEHWSAS